MHLPALHVPRRDDEPLDTVTEQSRAEHTIECRTERAIVVDRRGQVAHSAPPASSRRREDLVDQLLVVLGDLLRPEARTERKCDDPTSRGTRDQIEGVTDPDTEIIFKPGQHMSREECLGATPIERENLEPVRVTARLRRALNLIHVTMVGVGTDRTASSPRATLSSYKQLRVGPVASCLRCYERSSR